jgi:hypothetical protein
MTMTKEEINATFTTVLKGMETLSTELGEDVDIMYHSSLKCHAVFLHEPKSQIVTHSFSVESDDDEVFANEPGMLISTFSLDYCIERERKQKEQLEMWEDEMRADAIEDYQPEEDEEEDEEEDDA